MQKAEYVLKKMKHADIAMLCEMVKCSLFLAQDEHELEHLLLYELYLYLKHKESTGNDCKLKMSPALAYVLFVYLNLHQFTNPHHEHLSYKIIREIDKQRAELTLNHPYKQLRF